MMDDREYPAAAYRPHFKPDERVGFVDSINGVPVYTNQEVAVAGWYSLGWAIERRDDGWVVQHGLAHDRYFLVPEDQLTVYRPLPADYGPWEVEMARIRHGCGYGRVAGRALELGLMAVEPGETVPLGDPIDSRRGIELSNDPINVIGMRIVKMSMPERVALARRMQDAG